MMLMACFITPLITGLLLKLIKKLVKPTIKNDLEILEIMLITGGVILAIEHVWHGEIVPYPPFLTAMQNPSDIPVLLREISVVGGSMTIATAVTWFSIISLKEKLKEKMLSTRILRVKTK